MVPAAGEPASLQSMTRWGWEGPVIVGAAGRALVWAAGLGSFGWWQRDSGQYWALSTDLLASYGEVGGHGFEWSLMRPPGYPVLLSLMRAVSDTIAGVALLQTAFGIAAIALVYLLGAKLADRAVAAIAAWWLALSPIHIVDSSVLLTEVPFSVFLLAGILLVAPIASRDDASLWRWAAAGGTLGFAALVRPIALYLPLAVIMTVLLSPLRGRLGRPALLFLVAFALPVGGWVARNHAVTGVATMSTIEGLNLAYYRGAGAIAAEQGIPIEDARQQIEARVRAESFPGINPGELARIQRQVGIREIVGHPKGYAIAAARGLARMLGGPARSHFVERFRQTRMELLTQPLVLASAASAILLTIASAFGAVAWGRAREWRPLLLIGVPLGYMLLISAGYEAWARFRVPIEPLLAILAGVGVQSLCGTLAPRIPRAGQRVSPSAPGPRRRSR